MAKRIIIAALLGWSGIIGFAYRLAGDRIELCYSGDEACIIATTATRDGILITGLIVALVGLIVLAVIATRSAGRLNGLRSANPGNQAQLR
jgi:hypothetical protein